MKIVLLDNHTFPVRNIENNKELQKIYSGVRWLVIDAGHRIRAFSKGGF